MLFFTTRKGKLIDLFTKIYLNNCSYKNVSVYQHPYIDISFFTKQIYITVHKVFENNMMNEMIV